MKQIADRRAKWYLDGDGREVAGVFCVRQRGWRMRFGGQRQGEVRVVQKQVPTRRSAFWFWLGGYLQPFVTFSVLRVAPRVTALQSAGGPAGLRAARTGVGKPRQARPPGHSFGQENSRELTGSASSVQRRTQPARQRHGRSRGSPACQRSRVDFFARSER